MRIGACPQRVKRDFIRPARVTVCVVVHIPHQLDYYADRLDVLKLCLGSLAANTPRDAYELMVLDNASCTAVVQYLTSLRDQGAIDQLILSARNIGKINACRMLFEAAPAELVAYADDDVWFGPGWLSEQLAIVATYPRVGMVSARPVRRQFAYGNRYLFGYLQEFPGVTAKVGRFIPDEWEDEYQRSTGHLYPVRGSADNTDVLLEYDGVQAYSTATHFQFVAPRSVILEAMRKHDQPRTGSEERQFEEALDAMGYARLSTAGRYVRHIGNVISRELLNEVGGVPDINSAAAWRPWPSIWVRVTRLRPVRAVLSWLNHRTYQLLHHP